MAFFGAPVSYENNVERALEFTLALQNELLPLQINNGLRFKVGIAEGIAYAGVIGGKERSQYAAVGNRVNIAARLMMSANWGEVLVDEVVHKNRNYRFQHTGDISYKGLKNPIPTYKITGRNQEQHRPFDGVMVGREQELDKLETFAMQAFETSQAAVAYVYGEPGIGKTRLSYELRNRLRKRRSPYWMVCQSDQILRKPFNPFVYLLKNYFGQKPTNSPEANLQSFEHEFKILLDELVQIANPATEGIKREIVRTKPVLAALTGLKTTDSLWNDLDAKGRYQNTLAALSALVQAEALLGPVVMELEDGHWFDPSSMEFLGELAGRIRNMPIFVLVTSRYDDEGNKPKLFSEAVFEKNGLPLLEIDLNILDNEAMNGFASERLKGKISPELLELLLRTSNGNPFYAEQMLEYFMESGQLEERPNGWMVKDQNVRFSNSIQAVLTARIDRLSSLVKETIKAAAVIGREFELPVLTEVMMANEELVQHNGNSTALLKEQVKTAERAQIWQAMNELRYIFRHSLLREAVYDMQLKTRIKELHHHIGEAIEKLYEHNLEQRYVDLVFHYEQSEDENKLREYLQKAADYAKEYYQNQQALHFYDKLIVILEKQGNNFEKAKTLLKKSSILELVGRWEEAEALAREALEVAQIVDDGKVLGRANDALGHLLMLKGRYEEADGYLETAAAFFGSSHDDRGTSKVYGHLGTLYFRQGKYEDAKLYFIRSIQLAQLYKHTSSLAQIVATLGLTYMNLGKYDDGIRWQQSQLEACQKVNDRQGMATLLTNMGIVHFEKGEYDQALDCYQRGLDLAEELGNKQLTSIAIGCIGSVWQRKGRFDLAQQHFERDLALTEELGDKQGTCIALGLLGDLYSVMGKFDEAISFMQRNLKLGEELGYRKGVAKSLNTLGDIYFYKNELETSLNFYDRSIETTRSIGNKLVLGFSLVEKANVLLAKGSLAEVLENLREATTIAGDIKHPDLLFEVRLMAGKLAIRNHEIEEAINVFDALLALKRGRRDEALVQFEYSKIESGTEHRERALELFMELHKETPVHVYQLKLNELEQ
ncbi:MAG: tetratricopeptide repeat protein [Saprospiraceae bacterium]|nr:tetratricopeptide repeat protein [Saprospiraceae bacterium]